MSYHKFPNLREQLQADLGSKLIKNVGSLDFDTLPCNCNARTKVNGDCPYSNLCRHSIVVYKATCSVTQKFYIGCTQQKLKTRMTQHFNETVNAANKGQPSDTFAIFFPSKRSKERKQQRNTFETVPLSKSCGRATCYPPPSPSAN